MRNVLVKSTLAAILLSSPFAVTEAAAKLKEAKFHIVQGAYENLPAMEMKFSGGKWVWSNKSDHFKPRLKVYFKASRQSAAVLNVQDIGKVWGMPANYYTRKYEKLITLGIGKAQLSGAQNKAVALCDVFGGSKKVVRDMNLPATLVVADQYGVGGQRSGSFPVKVVCQAKPDPTRNPVSMNLTKLKLYTIPAQPKCGKPVKLVGEFHTNKPGKVDFVLFRGDGANQKASVTTSKGGSGYVKRWAKTYTFKKTTIRKYMIVPVGHKKSTPWVPVHVRCDATKGISG